MGNNTVKTPDLYNKIYLDKGRITIDGIPLKRIQRFEIKNTKWSDYEEPEVTITIKAKVVGLGDR
ncbi:hypothetical protein QFF56_02810 [Ligilactobacillus animalis]|uniref:Uncharacterized protein n=1 Tax=Ligilactobacillus animalis TaxID=1605 RepID=A0AAJ6JWN4_9LACO|nr:hypothetical protein [Ligilactobacillus animalis]WHQ80631.1 hypothetical protein QFF56_02810 [Ligilactobacillus animalis]